jgi:acyl dehydratase
MNSNEISKHIDSMNAKLSRIEKINASKILSQPFTREGGEFTPTMKVESSSYRRSMLRDRCNVPVSTELLFRMRLISMIDKNLANTKFEELDFPVESGKIKEFAGAICDKNPIYLNSKYAKSKGFEDVLMPVTFPMTFLFHVTSENAVLEMMQKLGMDAAKTVHGEIEFIYERPVCAGETLHAVVSVGNIYEKTGKRGGDLPPENDTE